MLFKMAVSRLQTAILSVTWLVTAMRARSAEVPTGCLYTPQPAQLEAALPRPDGHFQGAIPTPSQRVP